VDAVWIELFDERFETSRIVGILPFKLHQGIGAIR
jgi:hypothetical protein